MEQIKYTTNVGSYCYFMEFKGNHIPRIKYGKIINEIIEDDLSYWNRYTVLYDNIKNSIYKNRVIGYSKEEAIEYINKQCDQCKDEYERKLYLQILNQLCIDIIDKPKVTREVDKLRVGTTYQCTILTKDLGMKGAYVAMCHIKEKGISYAYTSMDNKATYTDKDAVILSDNKEEALEQIKDMYTASAELAITNAKQYIEELHNN